MNAKLDAFEVTGRNKLRLMRKRGAYDKETVYRILDSALICNVGYVIESQPYVTPTAFWREQNRLYWHGSSASRALNAQSKDIPVCLTVSHVDGLVLARSGFHSSVNYRSVMAFGHASAVEDEAHKRRAMDIYVDRFVPGRTSCRTGQPVDDDEDYALPVWAGVINFKNVVAGIAPDPRNLSSVKLPDGLTAYAEGRLLDETFSVIYDGNTTSSHG
jgi:uncharacterized protein